MQGMFAKKLALVFTIRLAAVFLSFFGWQPTDAISSEPSPSVLASDDESSQETGPAFAFMKGRWRRPDGGYVIDIRDVEPTGKVDAAYFNPKPIHISKAEATRDGTATKVFIELRDVGYPGSTYTLTYDPHADQLRGIYFQAALRQNFDVVFYRIK